MTYAGATLSPTSDRQRADHGDLLWPVQLCRGLAALMVVIGHGQTALGWIARERGWAFHRWQPIPWGASVDLFFVISGIIMVYASRRLFAAPNARAVFVRRRLARVVPLYWACTGLYLLLLAAAAWKGGAPLPSWPSIAASYLFLPFASETGMFPVFDVGWTLNYEIMFYALFAAIIVLPFRRTIVILPLLIGSIVLLGAFIPADLVAPFFWTRPILLDFALGAVVGSLALLPLRLPNWSRIAMIAVGGAIFFSDPMHLFSGDLGFTVENGWPRVLSAGLPAAIALAGALWGTQPALPRLLAPAVLLGDASYSLYLTHPFVLIVLEKLVQKSPAIAAIDFRLLAAVTVVMAVIVALGCFRWFETPLNIAVKRLTGRRRARIGSEAAV